MKKIKYICLILLVIFLIPSVYAGTAYADSININAKINSDGSMKVTETIRWDIDESLNGLYRDILITNPANELNGASKVEINEVIVDGKNFNYSDLTLQNGASGKYNINDIKNGKQIKIFTPSRDGYKTTKITYTLYDVVVKYNDVAEMYWNFIGDGWEYGIDNVNINITLPGSSNMLKVFAHGPLNGYSEIINANSVALNVSGLRRGEQVDARLLFDNSLVDTTKRVYENKLESILEQEGELAKQANLKREIAKKSFWGAIIITVIALLAPIIIYIRARKKASKPVFNGKYYRELPEDYGPAIMNKLLNPVMGGSASSKDMLATLLDLVRKKYVEIEPIINGKNKQPKDYLLKLVNTDLSELNESEKHFVDNLIFVGTTEITLKELSKKNSKSVTAQNEANKAYLKWQEIVKKIAEEKDLLKADNIKIGMFKYILCFLLPIGVATYGGTYGYDDIIGIGILGIIVSIFELIIIMLSHYDLNIRTEKGIEHNAMWKAFKKFLLDFSKLDEHDYKSIAIWEHYLVYATALGVSKQVIKELKIIFPTEFEQDTNMFSTYTTIGILANSNSFGSFESSFTSAAGTAFSHASSSSGSGGGFSGGGGGRWRRRRRWRLLIPRNQKENKHMSSYIMHMCVSHIVKKKLNLTDKFVYGSALPDILKTLNNDRKGTHYLETVIINGERRNVPIIQNAIEQLDIEDEEIRLGYIAHLIEDLIWFKKYIPSYTEFADNGKIRYLSDGSIHTSEQFREDIYSDYSNSSEYVMRKCNVDGNELISSLENMVQDKQHMELIKENMTYIKNVGIDNNVFMTKESIDSYIEESTQEVERIILGLLGEKNG